MATGDKKRAVMTTDIDNGSSTYPVLSPSGDGSDVTAAFTAAASRTNISTGEKLGVIFGKIAKWLSDLGAAAFRGVDAAPTAGSTNLAESGGVKSALTPVGFPLSIASWGADYITSISNCFAYKVGSIAIVTISCYIAATPTGWGGDLIAGFPEPARVCPGIGLTGAGNTFPLSVSTRGTLSKGSDNPTSAGYYITQFVYPTAE